jgi:L-aspartate oxidase
MSEQDGAPVLLDATAIGADRLAHRFPGLDEACRQAGYDWAAEPVPITPAAHYAMGGVVTDLDGRTSLPGLFAVGETARTGVHGANRLASNSLLEAAVFADRAARAIGTPALAAGDRSSPATPAAAASAAAAGAAAAVTGAAAPAPVTAAPVTAAAAAVTAAAAAVTGFRDSPRRAVRVRSAAGVSSEMPESGDTDAGGPFVEHGELQALMWQHVGLERSAAGLAEASARLSSWRSPEPLDRRSAEDRNLLDLARLTVAAALARNESIGAHFRTDDPRSQAPAATLEKEAA